MVRQRKGSKRGSKKSGYVTFRTKDGKRVSFKRSNKKRRSGKRKASPVLMAWVAARKHVGVMPGKKMTVAQKAKAQRYVDKLMSKRGRRSYRRVSKRKSAKARRSRASRR